MFGTIVSSLVGILQYYSNPDAIKLFVMWNLGSLSAVTWQHLHFLLPIVILSLSLTFLIHRSLDSLLLGENYAKGLGISILRSRLFVILATGILAGASTAFTGPIGFIGIAVPHLARGIFQTSDHKVILPASIACGASLLLLCDIVSQISAYAIPINAVSALFGAPLIIYIILRKR